MVSYLVRMKKYGKILDFCILGFFNSDNFNFLKIIFKKIYLSLHIKSFNSNCYHNSTIISSSIHTSTITLYTH